MNIMLYQLKRKLIALVGDDVNTESRPLSGSLYNHQTLIDAINSALIAILPYSPNPKVYVTELETTSIRKPFDFYRLEGIMLPTFEFIEPLLMKPSTSFPSKASNFYVEYPNDFITFLSPIPPKTRVYYSAPYQPLLDDVDILGCPGYCEIAILCYAASFILIGAATTYATGLSPYKSRIDSGTPEDNPIARQSEFLLRRFEYEVAKFPKYQRGTQ